MRATNMQEFGDVLDALTPEIVKRYQEQQAECQAEKAEIAAKPREKYGFEVSDYDIEKITRAETENAICQTCKGLPCKKTVRQNPKWQNVIKADPLLEKINISVRPCQFVLTARLQKSVERNFELAKIPEKYKGKTFSNYLTDNTNTDAVKSAEEFLTKPKQGLLFYGKPGRGKTLLAAITAQEFLKQGKSVIFGDVPSLLEDLRNNYSRKNDSRLEEQMNALVKADLVVLDDIGTEKPTEWAVNRLYLIINERYNTNKPLIVTSNYTSKEIAERLNNPTDAKTAGVTGSRIVSRLTEMCEVLTIRGDDRRVFQNRKR